MKACLLATTFGGAGYPHLADFIRTNPGMPFHLAEFEEGHAAYRSLDLSIARWWLSHRDAVKEDYVFHSDWDTLIASPLSRLLVREFDGVMSHQIDNEYANSMWYSEEAVSRLPAEAIANLHAFNFSLCLFSRSALDELAGSLGSFWAKTDIFCEVRAATVLRMSGKELGFFADPELRNSLRPSHGVSTRWVPGVFHPFKGRIDTFDYAFSLVGDRSDKITLHSYGEFYDIHAGHLRGVASSMLELGIGSGGCLHGWRNYLGPLAEISGVDVNVPAMSASALPIRMTAANYLAPEFADSLPDGELDLIVDDGAHDADSQFRAFVNLHPKLKPGGTYIVEDVENIEVFLRRFDGVPLCLADRRCVKGRWDDVIVKVG